MQPVSMLMSNLNLESAAKVSPNAYAAAQDTGQSQEIIREGIRLVQTVQASDAAAEAQRVHRKNGEDDQQGQGRQSDTFTQSHSQDGEREKTETAPPIPEKPKTRAGKSFEFLA